MVTAKERLTRSWGLHDAIEFLSELHYDVSPLGNEEIFQLLEEVLRRAGRRRRTKDHTL